METALGCAQLRIAGGLGANRKDISLVLDPTCDQCGTLVSICQGPDRTTARCAEIVCDRPPRCLDNHDVAFAVANRDLRTVATHRHREDGTAIQSQVGQLRAVGQTQRACPAIQRAICEPPGGHVDQQPVHTKPVAGQDSRLGAIGPPPFPDRPVIRRRIKDSLRSKRYVVHVTGMAIDPSHKLSPYQHPRDRCAGPSWPRPRASRQVTRPQT